MNSKRRFVARGALAIGAVGLLLLSAQLTRQRGESQSAVPLSKPGQEDLSFWVNHKGLLQFEAEGEVGFGDIARILLRRRANGEAIRELRDRFTFRCRTRRH